MNYKEFLVILIGLTICYTWGLITQELYYKTKYDYFINLDDNVIEIKTIYNEVYIINPDSLQSFIIKDNI